MNVLKISDGSLALFLSIVFAAVGLPALWAAFLLDPSKFRTRRPVRRVVAAALFLGLLADAYWIRMTVISPPPGPASVNL